MCVWTLILISSPVFYVPLLFSALSPSALHAGCLLPEGRAPLRAVLWVSPSGTPGCAWTWMFLSVCFSSHSCILHCVPAAGSCSTPMLCCSQTCWALLCRQPAYSAAATVLVLFSLSFINGCQLHTHLSGNPSLSLVVSDYLHVWFLFHLLALILLPFLSSVALLHTRKVCWGQAGVSQEQSPPHRLLKGPLEVAAVLNVQCSV